MEFLMELMESFGLRFPLKMFISIYFSFGSLTYRPVIKEHDRYPLSLCVTRLTTPIIVHRA